MGDLPEPLVPADVDLRDVPMPRDILVKLAMQTFGVTEREADDFIQRFFAERPQ